jgi:hypothetical protein
MTQWYLSFDGNQAGPMDLSTAIAQARQNPNGFAWRDGFAEWQPIASIAELNPVPGAPVPAPPPAVARGTGADEIDFKIFGAEMQFVEVELDPGESAVAEAGAMMYKDSRSRCRLFSETGPRRPVVAAAASWTSSWGRASDCSPVRACS